MTALSDFVDSINTISDIRNMDEFNPVAIEVRHPISAAAFIILAAVKPPTSILVPLYGIWIDFNPTSANYRKVFRAMSFNSSGQATWEEVVTYDNLWLYPQEYLLSAGPPGSQGPMGPQGPIGLTGPQGPAGAQGSQGIQGPVGPIGPQGAQGPAGPVGAQGPQGPAGQVGPNGAKGDKGDPGAQGPQGVQGPQGPVGPEGPQGPKGDTGYPESFGIGGMVLYDVFGTNETQFDTLAKQYPVIEHDYERELLRTDVSQPPIDMLFTEGERVRYGSHTIEIDPWTKVGDVLQFSDTVSNGAEYNNFYGLISADYYTDFDFEALFFANQESNNLPGISGTSGIVGLVVGFQDDDPVRTLTLMRRPGTATTDANRYRCQYNWGLVGSAGANASFNASALPAESGWTAQGVYLRMRAVRVGNIITMYTSHASATKEDAVLDPATIMVFDISTGTADQKTAFLDRQCRIGLAGNLLKSFTVEDIKLTTASEEAPVEYFDYRDQKFWSYDFSTGIATEIDTTINDEFGIGRLVYHQKIGRVYYAPNNAEVHRLTKTIADFDLVKIGNVVESELDYLRLVSSSNLNFYQAFTSWRRFSHAPTTNAQPANPVEMRSWQFNDSTGLISSTLNSVSYLGFISPQKYSGYELTVEVGSTDSDDDAIGVVVAFAIDNSGKEHTISLIRCGGNTNQHSHRYCLVYNFQCADEAVLVDADSVFTDVTWSGKKARLYVKREGSVITIGSSAIANTLPDPSIDNGVDPASIRTFDLSQMTNSELFTGACSIGFSAWSQNSSYFSTFSLKQLEVEYYDVRDATYYKLDQSGSPEVVPNSSSESVFGIGTVVSDTRTGRLYFVERNGNLRRIVSSAEDAALGSDCFLISFDADSDFTVGQVLSVSSAGKWIAASTASADASCACAVVTEVLNARKFVIRTSSCRVDVLDQTLTVGQTCYLSATAGVLTQTRPSSGPIVPVGRAIGANRLMFVPSMGL